MRRQLAHPHFAGPQSQRELPTQKAEVEPTEELGRDGIQLHRSQKWHSRHHKLLHTQGITPPLPSLLCSPSFIGPLPPLVPPSTGPPLHRSPPSTGSLPSLIPSLHRFPPFTAPLPPPVPSLHWSLPTTGPSHNRSPPTTGPLPPPLPSFPDATTCHRSMWETRTAELTCVIALSISRMEQADTPKLDNWREACRLFLGGSKARWANASACKKYLK